MVRCLDRERLGESYESGLRRRVRREHWPRSGRSAPQNVDDPTSACCLHAWDEGTTQSNRYKEVETDSLLELARWHLPGRPDRSLNRGVVDKDGDPSYVIGRLAHPLRRIRI